MKTEKPSSARGEYALPILAAIFVLVVWFLTYCVILNWNFQEKDSATWAMRGQFGDLFGAANSLFSGFAFGGIIITIFLQKQELKAQRNELEQTRREFKKQNVTLARQRFENTFFSMLTIHNGIVASLDFKGERGIRTFDPLMKLFAAVIDPKWMTYDPHKPMFSTYREFLLNSWPDHLKYFSQYLQSLTALYTAIIDYSKKEKPRQRYFKILKSYLSDQEKQFLFYYILFASEFSSTNVLLNRMERDLDLFSDAYYPRLHHSHKGFLTDPNRRSLME